MAYLLLAADPEDKIWTVIAQSDNPDEIIDAIDHGDPSLRIAINTENYVTFDTRETGNASGPASSS